MAWFLFFGFIGMASGYLYLRHRLWLLVKDTSYDLDQEIELDYEIIR